MDNISREEFNKFLEEMNVVIADIGAGENKLAWNYYNDHIFNIKTKENKLLKGDK